MKQGWKLKSGLLLAMIVSSAYADDGADARITQLQKMLEQQQKAMQEQQWQLKAMADELKALQQKSEVAAVDKEAPVVKAGEKGFGIQSADGKNSINLHGTAQIDYRNIESGSAIGTSSGLIVRKARPWIEGTLFGWIDYRLTPEFATTTANAATVSAGTTTVNNSTTLGTPEVIDAFADFKFQPWLKLRAGKFKPFVGLARLQSDTDGKFLEQSFVTANLLPQRDVGLSLFGDVLDGRLNYAVGVSNGVIDGGDQSVALDNNNNKEFTARLFAQPFKGKESLLAGLGFGLAGTTIDQQGTATNTQLPAYKTFGQNNFFSYTTTSGSATYAHGQRSRWSPQAYYYFGPFGLMAEYAEEHQEVSRLTNNQTLNHDAWQVTASYVLTGEEASYGGVKPKQPFSPDGKGWGAWEVVARYNEINLDGKSFVGTNGLTTGLNPVANPTAAAKSAEAWGVGLNWYLNNYSRFSLDFEQTDFVWGGGGTVARPLDRPAEKTMIGRLQLAF